MLAREKGKMESVSVEITVESHERASANTVTLKDHNPAHLAQRSLIPHFASSPPPPGRGEGDASSRRLRFHAQNAPRYIPPTPQTSPFKSSRQSRDLH